MIDFDRFTLENGLRVIVHTDPSVAKVAVNTLYHVGARDEQPERTGMAHLFEHLMFGGSRNIPDFDTHVQRAGGENNAFTNNDITNYYIVLPATQVETALWLESDRMLELDFSQRSLDVQKSVVIEEFKQRYLNQPYGDAYLHLRPLHYKVHPYRWMTIGEKVEHIEGVNLDHIRSFFYSHYAPNNATLVLAGDITLPDARQLVQKWFGSIPRRDLAPCHYPAEPVQTEARRATVTGKVPHASVYRAYHSPTRTDPTHYAADLLTDLLASGKGARLYQRLVKERRVASSVSAFDWGLYGPSMLSINGQVADGISVADYEAALDEALSELHTLTSDELDRAIAKIESQDAFEKTEVAQRAMALAIYDSIDDAGRINTDLDHYRAVTVAELQSAAAQLFRPENSSTLVYLPNA